MRYAGGEYHCPDSDKVDKVDRPVPSPSSLDTDLGKTHAVAARCLVSQASRIHKRKSGSAATEISQAGRWAEKSLIPKRAGGHGRARLTCVEEK